MRKPYTIYDWEKMDIRTRYVALSRGTTIEHVNIAGSGRVTPKIDVATVEPYDFFSRMTGI